MIFTVIYIIEYRLQYRLHNGKFKLYENFSNDGSVTLNVSVNSSSAHPPGVLAISGKKMVSPPEGKRTVLMPTPGQNWVYIPTPGRAERHLVGG